MMKLLLALTLMVSIDAQAAPSAKFYLRNNIVNGEPELVVQGRDLCDSDTYRIRVSDSLTGDSGWYMSNSGRTSWGIHACTFSMQLSQKILIGGNILELRTYRTDLNGNRRKTHSFVRVIPCDHRDFGAAFLESVWIYDNESVELPDCRRVVTPTPEPLRCRSEVRVSSESRSRAGLLVACSEAVGSDVRIYNHENGNLLCKNERFYATRSLATACTFARDPMAKLSYLVEIRTGRGELLSQKDILVKDPSYLHEPEGDYKHGSSITPPKKKKLFGRGFYWPVTINGVVSDADVDPSEGKARIKVELIMLYDSGERVLKTATVNSRAEFAFSIEHEYRDPFFGQPKRRGELQQGTNRLFVRVWDAYEGNSRVDLPVI
ncbi:MAG TPA: hypothetical protein VFV50_12755, partial [Bdellovibrionales bacterium]|nr:hypothetical protein [Bdellovibrionales bacterium]